MKKTREPFEKTDEVASATECTGLMPVLPEDEMSAISYAEIFGIHKAAKPCPKYRRK